ncbi:MAG: hypothetical protein F6K47_21170 [Symploca sp. SIO2E6]|nr:hypothetical protein [Symploca sp. SIO2E6]
MATLQIENLPDELYNRIQSLAAGRQLTLNEAVIHLLQQAFEPNERTIIQEHQTETMSTVLRRIRNRPRVDPISFGLPDSTVLIREDRNR